MNLSQNLTPRPKYARIEQERRFLLKSLPADFDQEATFVKIIDHYFPETRLRLRRMETPASEILAYKLGQKYRTALQSPHQTIMTNLYLNESEYRLISALEGKQIVKRRYHYLFEQHSYSIDVFEENLNGLLIAEIEGRAGVEIMRLPVPAFAAMEITGDPFFSGGQLAQMTALEFQKWFFAWIQKED